MRKATTSIVTLILIAGLGFTSVHAQVDEFTAMAEEAMPAEVGDQGTVGSMLEAHEAGAQFSQNWSVEQAFRALNDKLSPSKGCYLERQPNGDPSVPLEECIFVRGNPVGETDASVLQLNLGEGTLKYINRGRDVDPLAEQVKLDPQVAVDSAFKLGEALGLPATEFAKEFAQAKQGIMTGFSLETEEVSKRFMEMHVVVPRCMPVGGTLNSCVPVFDSGLQVNFVNDANGNPVPSWIGARWADFKLASYLQNTLERREVIDRTAAILKTRAQSGTISQLQIFTAYVQGEALLATEESFEQLASCVPDDVEKEDTGRELETRSYIPAVVVYAHPNQPDGDENTTDSTGGFQYAVPLIEPASCEQG